MHSAEIADRIQSFTRKQAALFGATCAARVAPAFVAFASEPSADELDEWLQALWALIEVPDATAARDLSARIFGAPEADVDDSNRPEYYAMRALGVLAYAVQILTDDDIVKPALWCADSAVSLLRDFDYVLGAAKSAAG